LCSGFGWGIIAALGCLTLYQQLAAIEMKNEQTQMWVRTMIPVGLFLVLGLLIFWILNRPTLANFMIDAEGEMKKVSWSSRKEIAVSTLVVIIVVVLMAVFLGVVDLAFNMFFTYVIGI
jgi:preprotein translocase subunit SecE